MENKPSGMTEDIIAGNKSDYNNTYPPSDERFKKWLKDNHWEDARKINALYSGSFYNIIKIEPRTSVFKLYDQWYNTKTP